MTPRSPLVSVVTPTFQRATLLERTLRSVAAQDYATIEHIVVDAGSSDGTVELLQRWERDHRVRWVSEPDRGMYDAINKGMRMATGEIVAYLNSDDCYFPWTIAVAVDTLRRFPEADLVYGHVIRQDDARGIIVPVFQPHFLPGLIARFGSLLQPTVFMRRAVFEELGGFDDRLRFVSDNDFWLRAAQTHRFRGIDEFLAYELFHAETLSQTRRDEMAAEDLMMRARHQRRFANGHLPAFAAELAWQAGMSARWLAFGLSTKSWTGGWLRSRAGLEPFVSWNTLVRGVLPARGARRRATVRWTVAPERIAIGHVD